METKINYKSDFDVILHLKDCNDKTREIPFPECDFDVHFWTSSRANVYTASYKDGVYTNCWRTEDGGMHFVFNDHHLGTGVLKWEPHFRLPNDIYPDNRQDIYRPETLDIELVPNQGDCPTIAEVEALAPYIKGDKGEPFTYEDFTPEQIADLKRPATEAAERADKAVRAAEKATQEAVASNKQLAGNVAEAAGAETERVEAETARVTAETQRQSAEDTRKANEVERVKAEGLRDSNEATRESQEAERQSAETGRINAEKARVSAEASRVAAETKRASDFTEAEAQRQSTFESAEAERAQAEATRVSNESIRIGNEQSRVNAEHTRASQETARQDAESARQSNEQSRVTAEGARVEAETVRAAEFAGFADTIAAKQDKITTSEDLSLSEENVLSLTDMAKKRLFIDLWNQAAGDYGRYNEDTGFFELYEIYDIGWDEALLIYRISGNKDYLSINYYWSTAGVKNPITPRTFLPWTHIYNSESSISAGSNFHNDSIQYLSFVNNSAPSPPLDWRCLVLNVITHGFRFAKLIKLYGIIQISTVYNNSSVFNMPNLVYGNFKFIRGDYTTIYFRANLDFECTNYLFTNIPTQNANGQCVFKLAANMFNRLNGTATDYETSGGTKEEWMALADLAASKNITLATE